MNRKKTRRGTIETLESRQLLAIDLAVTFTDVPNTVSPGEQAAYGFRVSNSGDEVAECVLIEHQPRGLSDASWVQNHKFRPDFNLHEMDGQDGFTIGSTLTRRGLFGEIVGDVNADGIDDLLVSIVATRGGTPNTVAVVFGGPEIGANGYLPDLEILLDGHNGFFIRGVSALDDARIGDVNGDGIDDFVVRSASSADTHHVVFGKEAWASEIDVEVSDISEQVSIVSDPSVSMQSAGDFNGDGVNDIAVLTKVGESNRVQVLLGRSDFGETKQVQLAGLDDVLQVEQVVRTLDLAGDFNGDGYDDLVAVSRNSGVWLVEGGSYSADSESLKSKELSGTSYLATGIGDVNGDGFDDIATTDNDGIAIKFGQSDLESPTNHVSVAHQLYRGLLLQAGDINADGIGDFIIGSIDQAIVMLGASDLAEKNDLNVRSDDVDGFIASRIVWQDGESFVRSASGRGDINGDGVDDIVLGGSHYWDASEQEVHVLLGQPQNFGRGRIHERVQIRPGEIVEYSISGAVPPNLQDFEVDATVTDCWGSRRRPVAHLDIEVKSPDRVVPGESAEYEIRVTNNDVAAVTATLDSALSDWLVSPEWQQSLGYSPVVDIEEVEPYQKFSWRIDDLESSGDFNGDGRQDMVFSSPTRSGTVYHDVKFGGLEAVVLGSGPGSGWIVSSVGDLNGDGFDDRASASDVEAVYLVFGAAEPEAYRRFTLEVEVAPYSMVAVGDVNGDGLDDFAIRYGSTAGAIVYGAEDLTRLPVVTVRANMGSALRAGGDINGDGFDDVVAIAEDSTVIYWGGASLNSDQPASLTIRGGDFAEPIGDINGDGYGDLLLSISSAGRHRGFVFLGSPTLTVTDTIDLSPGTNEHGTLLLGDGPIEYVKGLGDFNHDGFDDFLIRPDGNPVSAYILLGAPSFSGSEQFDISLLDGFNGFELHDPRNAYRSTSVLASGDVNGDGIDDFTFLSPNVHGWSDVITLLGEQMIHDGTGDLEQKFELSPGATARFTVSGEARASETTLGVDVIGCRCLDQSESDLTDNTAEIAIEVIPAPLPGDVNGDDHVTFADFLIVSANFGRTSDVTPALGDLNGDGAVGFDDFQLVASNFGRQRAD